uniref:Uncharacterized protein n=1 Tax=Chromera velia CCMP2878 TaxID=1169474 RepID=A0A0G4HFS4_9ALVE|eukprot:Cvel_998.t1-p1 / transcript=Cvel_998.t1 / gene=Cvel_998 / organism=Chromera_velia_CCMP2878 / gene_product=hypothetical protein / transcript_product=hypothetical protein / location=Cvel_scaffold32:125482-126298(+) / protein_length=90 / sequence_SO=supercontig / SO=protein_coding / is_pseudo=false
MGNQYVPLSTQQTVQNQNDLMGRIEMGAEDVTAAFLTSKDHNAERIGTTLPLESVLPRVPDENPFKDIPNDKYEELKRMAAKYEPGGSIW